MIYIYVGSRRSVLEFVLWRRIGLDTNNVGAPELINDRRPSAATTHYEHTIEYI